MSDAYLLPLLNALAESIHDRNIRLGFYEPDTVRPFDGMLMNVVAEVAEAQEEWRAGRDFNETHYSIRGQILVPFRFEDGKLYIAPNSEGSRPDEPELEWYEMTPELLRRFPYLVPVLKPEGIPSELADIIIRVLDICAYHGIDIAAAIADKMAFNESRPHRHGGKRS